MRPPRKGNKKNNEGSEDPEAESDFQPSLGINEPRFIGEEIGGRLDRVEDYGIHDDSDDQPKNDGVHPEGDGQGRGDGDHESDAGGHIGDPQMNGRDEQDEHQDYGPIHTLQAEDRRGQGIGKPGSGSRGNQRLRQREQGSDDKEVGPRNGLFEFLPGEDPDPRGHEENRRQEGGHGRVPPMEKIEKPKNGGQKENEDPSRRERHMPG